MTTIANKFAAKATVAVVAAAMALSTFAVPASAQTTEDLQQMIDALLAQVAQLQSQVGQTDATPTPGVSSVCPYTWTRDLSSGSTGMDVNKLQQFLNSDPDTRVAMAGSVGGPGMETEYYGPATAAAVSKMQVKYRADILSPANLVNPTGYFGPSSRAKANSLCVAAPVVVPPVVDEDPMDDEDYMDDEDEDMELGGEANLDSMELSDGESTVEEGEEDVVVGEIVVEFENGDAEISRLDVSLDGDDSNAYPWDAFDTISLWVDGDKIAEVDASDEDDYLNENNGTLRFSNLDLIAEEDEELEILVAVSVQNTVRSDEQTTWTLTVDSMRFFDADGVAETVSDPTDGDEAEFDLQLAGEDEALKISTASSNPDSADIIVDDSSDTNDVTIMVANLEAEDNDMELNTVVVRVDITGATSTDITDVVADAYVVIDGQSFKAESIGDEDDYAKADVTSEDGLHEGYSERAHATTSVWYYFDIDGDIVLEADEKTEMEVVVDLKDTDDSARYVNGTTIKASVQSDERGFFEAEGADDVTDFSGTAVGDVHTLIANGIFVPVDGFEFDISKVDADGKVYQYQIDFDVTAVEGDFYIDETAAQASTSPTYGVVYSVSPTTAGVTEFLSSTADEDSTSGAFIVREGETETFTLTVTVDPSAAGTFRVSLDKVFFTTDDDGQTGVEAYTLTPATDFRTNAQSIAN